MHLIHVAIFWNRSEKITKIHVAISSTSVNKESVVKKHTSIASYYKTSCYPIKLALLFLEFHAIKRLVECVVRVIL
jgi:hypothetical protein